MNKREFVDHEGKHYETKKDMCEAWDIPLSTFNKRIKFGWSIKDALTLPKQHYRGYK